jgi:hypothetical protein
MTVKIDTKELLYHLLFTFCVALPYINFYELTFAVWAVAVVLTIQQRYSQGFLRYVASFVGILVIAILVGIFKKADVLPYNFLKDITYLSKPILGLILGYQLCKNHVKNPMGFVVNTGLFIAIAHLSVVAFSFLFLHVRNINDLRLYAGYFSDFEIYALIVVLFHKQLGLELSRKKFRIALLLIGLSAFMYFARTNYIQFVVLLVAMKGYFVLTQKSLALIISLVIFTVVGYTIIYNSHPRRGASGMEAFFYKIKNAPIEAFKSHVDKDDWKDFNDNYRSYENIITVRQVASHGTAAVVLGEGLGSTIDLKKRVYLQTSWMRFIPFLHNGFMTVFLKSGLLGLFIYSFTFIYFFRFRRATDPVIRNINLLLLGTGIFLIISNWVFLGFYNLFDTKSILIGFVIAYKERLSKANTA